MRPSAILLVILFEGSILALSGCTQTSKVDHRFVGAWAGRFSWTGSINSSVPANITFHDDGTFSSSNSVTPLNRGNWSVNGTMLYLNGRFPPYNYTFNFSQGDTRLWLASINFSPLYLWNLTKA